MIWAVAVLWGASFLVGIEILKKMNENSGGIEELGYAKSSEAILKIAKECQKFAEENIEDSENQREEQEEKARDEAYKLTMQQILKLECEALEREAKKRKNEDYSYVRIVTHDGKCHFLPIPNKDFFK